MDATPFVQIPVQAQTNADKCCVEVACASIALPKRGRGRPSLGKPVLVVMDASEEAIARQMGGGVRSLGVRLALRAVQTLGVDSALAIAEQYKPEVMQPFGADKGIACDD